MDFFCRQDVEYQTQELVQKGMDAGGARLALKGALEALSEVDAFDADAIEGVLRPLAEDLGVKVGQLLGSLRVAGDFTVMGSNITMSAFMPSRNIPRSRISRRRAAMDVIFRMASSRVNLRSSRT